MPVLVAEAEVSRRQAAIIAPPVDIPPGGHDIRVQWAGVAGASDIDVRTAQVTISPDVVEQHLGVLTVSNDGNDRIVAVPAGKRIRYLTLNGVKTDANAPVVSSGDLAGRRLTVTVQSGGPVPSPQYAVPACPSRGMIPQSLTGASLANKVLALPDVAGSKLRLSLVEGSFPEEFVKHPWTLGEVSGVAAVLPHDLSLVEPDGATVVWAFPGEMPAGTPDAVADLRMSFKKLATAALKAGQPLDFTFKLKAADPARVGMRVSGASGALLRSFPGVLENSLEGDPVTLTLSAPALASEQPTAVTAGLNITYLGMRILEDLSDAFPAATGNVGGMVVEEDLAMHVFPPQAFDTLTPARIGVIGRAPVDCELSIQLVEMSGRSPGKAIAPPGVVRLSPSNAFSTLWADVPLQAPPGKPLACAVRATQGRFLWAASEHPLVRVAVKDPDPGGRPLKLNGASLVNVSQEKTRVDSVSLPATAFTRAAPALTSSLFLKVDLSDLALRYAR